MQRCDIHCHTRGSNMRLRDALPTPEQLIDYIKKRQKDLNITDFSFIRSPFVIENVSVYNDLGLVCNDCDDFVS